MQSAGGTVRGSGGRAEAEGAVSGRTSLTRWQQSRAAAVQGEHRASGASRSESSPPAGHLSSALLFSAFPPSPSAAVAERIPQPIVSRVERSTCCPCTGNEQNGENSHKEGSSWKKEVRNEVSTSPARILHAGSVRLIAFKEFQLKMHFLSQADMLLVSTQARKCECGLRIFICCFCSCCMLACAKKAEKVPFGWSVAEEEKMNPSLALSHA